MAVKCISHLDYAADLISVLLYNEFLKHTNFSGPRSPWTSRNFDYELISESTVPCPYDVMVVFASIMEFHEMSLLFWNKCKEPIVSGLVAAKIKWYDDPASHLINDTFISHYTLLR